MGVEYLDSEVLVFGSDLLALWSAWTARRQNRSVRLVLPPADIRPPALEPWHLGTVLGATLYDPEAQSSDTVTRNARLGSLAALRRLEGEWKAQLLSSDDVFHLCAPESPRLGRLQELLEEHRRPTLFLETAALRQRFALPEKCVLHGLQEESYKLSIDQSQLEALLLSHLEKAGVSLHSLQDKSQARFDLENSVATVVLRGSQALRSPQVVLCSQPELDQLGPVLPGGRFFTPVSAHLAPGALAPDLAWGRLYSHANWLFANFCLATRGRLEHQETGGSVHSRQMRLGRIPNFSAETDLPQARSELQVAAQQWLQRWFPFLVHVESQEPSVWLGDKALQFHPWRSDVLIAGGLGLDEIWWAPGLAELAFSEHPVAS